jgi:hypothetical protein
VDEVWKEKKSDNAVGSRCEEKKGEMHSSFFFSCPYFYEISAGMMRQKPGYSYGFRVERFQT